MATTVPAMAHVASQPITWSDRGSVNCAMIAGRMVRRIIMTMTGTATTPFSTALQYSARIGSIGEKFSATPSAMPTAIVA